MHFSIPDTQEFVGKGTAPSFTGFNIHINGNFHCCLRYKQLHSLHEQLKRSLPTLILPPFPPKKLFPLTPGQLEDRRANLERYIQLIGQDPVFSRSEILRTFLLNAQQESAFVEGREVSLDVYLMNGFRISVNVLTTECSTKVLEKACANIDLPRQFAYYFSLFLMRRDEDGTVSLVRKLMDFESPYISQSHLSECKIVIRKSYWDTCYDLELMQDKIALNLLYIQTISDVERGWIISTNEIRDELGALQTRGNKKEYLEIARSLPSYGSLQFKESLVDYPEANTRAVVTIGNKELSLRTAINSNKIQETKFKVTRIRCWKVTTIHNPDVPMRPNLELSFEYLLTKNCLKWITISSDQAMLMTVCLQSMVTELLNQKSGNDMNNVNCSYENNVPVSFVKRDESNAFHGSNGRMSESSSTDTISSLNENDGSNKKHGRTNSVKRKLKEKISTTVFFKNGKESVHNEAFEGIGDDDL